MVKKLNISIEYVIDTKSQVELLEELLKNEIHWAIKNRIDFLKETLVNELDSEITKDNIYINII
jgi:hypothetical protein